MPIKNSIINLLVYCFLFAPIQILSQTGQYQFRHITVNDGLSAPSVYSITKDKEGFIWLATGIGLFRYDGHEFKHYQSNPSDTSSLSGNLLTAQLFVDASNNLWVGTKDNGLNRFNTAVSMCDRFQYDPSNPTSISHNNIHYLMQDSSGIIWIATLGGGLNKFDETNKTFKAFWPDSENKSSERNSIRSLIEYSNDSLLVGTRQGMYYFNKKTGVFHPFAKQNESNHILNNIVIVDIVQENKLLWIATENGLIRYDQGQKTIKRYLSSSHDNKSLSNNTIRKMIDSPDGQYLWIATIWGLNSFDKHTGIVKRFLYDKNDETSLGYNMLWGLYFGSDNLLWIGTDNAGVDVLNLNNKPYQHHKLEILKNGNDQYSATVFCEKTNGEIWIGTFDGGLFQFDSTMKLLKRYTRSENKKNSLTSNSVFSIAEDKNEALWVGTSDGGFNMISSGRVENFKLEPKNASKPPSSVIEVMEDSEGTLWIGTLTGLYRYQHRTGQTIENIGREPLNNALIRSICEDNNGNVWIGTHSEGLFKLDKETISFKQYIYNADDDESINSNIVMAVYQDYLGTIWIATSQGLNKYNSTSDNFTSFNHTTGLASDYLYHIQGNKNGILWLSSASGLLRFDPTTENNHRAKLFDFKEGGLLAEIYPYSFLTRKNGEIYVGGKLGKNLGFFAFDPKKVKDNKRPPQIQITAFKVRNEPFDTDSSITAKHKIKLTYDQNFFSFEFAALDYINPLKNQYAYQLDGMENDWNYISNRRFANYTGVPPGNYSFRVKAANNDGYWNEEGTRLALTILPPPWKTWWAYFIYFILGFGIILSILYYYRRRQQLLYRLELEKVESDKLKEIDSMKSRFFSNISHEFRTPLTLILGPLEKLLSKVSDESQKKEVSVARKHAKRLQNLINQILDISKLEAGKMQLLATEVNLVEVLKTHIQFFESQAEQQKIAISFDFEKEEMNAWLDPEQFVQVLNNLLSNALKFTEEGGLIHIALKTTTTISQPHLLEDESRQQKGNNSWFQISISDTGKGIPVDQLKYVFDRFYQVDSHDNSHHQGTGIGLALTKELVELHHGIIKVESKQDTGTTFSIFLPAGKNHFSADEISVASDYKFELPSVDIQFQESEKNEISPTDNVSKEDGPILLIVEDNPDMRSYIRGYFADHYQIIEAADGQEGYEKSTEQIPDIIITDVMMPRMGGNEFCARIKSDERTSHIPVIMLTARAAKESRIEGLVTGADDFITKPFDGEELQIRVRNLIEQRKTLRRIFDHTYILNPNVITTLPEESGLISMDKKFMNKLISTLEILYSNPDLKVDDFCKEIGLSRVQLHRKLKALTGQSTSEFIRIFRLNRASEMIKKKTGTISEIAYDVGFNSPSYFTECFRKQFGKLPSDY